MKKIVLLCVLSICCCDTVSQNNVSSNTSNNGQPETELVSYRGAVHYTSPKILRWAEEYTDYQPGIACDDTWKTPEKSLKAATGDPYDIVCLGRGGMITYTFTENPVTNRDGADFAVFENSFSDTFLELAFVEVSSDGITFVRFPSQSLTAAPVSTYGTVQFEHVYDHTHEYTGFAGVHRAGYGTLFDLEDIEDSSIINTNSITHIRLVDIVGDGSVYDSYGNPVYDPYPCSGSAGFDCEAVGILSD